ncbi:MAG: tetraacyldisaccharide 4'-kinase [Candidatus Marinimicrobia bacterium]|nr:tetraacyldisaccharide 4'-kinase [Candidatus Neomarinimicrobiota bacterium]
MRFLLFPLAIVYGIITIFRNFCYDYGIFKRTKVSVPVISVGNITAGGTGKTPMTIYLAEEAKARGFTPGIVSRGYGRKSTGLQIVHDGNKLKNTVEISGDEPYLMASLLRDVPVIVSENRVAGADRLIQNYDVDLIILDDAFQHRKIYRDVDIVLMNAKEKSNAYHLLPMGQLREIPLGLKRAHYVVATKGDVREIPKSMQKFMGTTIQSSQLFQAKKYTSNGYESIEHCKDESCECVASPIFAFCGIANGDSFFNTLAEMKIETLDTISFKDHVEYDDSIMATLTSKINASNTKTIITTEKDLVKLPDSFFEVYNVHVLAMKMELPSKFTHDLFEGLQQVKS